MVSRRILTSQLSEHENQDVCLEGWVHRIRDLGGVRFVVVRDRAGLAQAVAPPEVDVGRTASECVVRVAGRVRREARAASGYELGVRQVEVLSPALPPPLEISRPIDAGRLETLLDLRALSLRIPDVLDVFRVEAVILRAFRQFLDSEGFTEVCTPKLVLGGEEGGAALFKVEYFERVAYLAQSPQFYKQMMVGSGLERVFEVGHVYRAEKSETSRHITEFVGLDFEMGFIDSEQDVIAMHARAVLAILAAVREQCAPILKRRGITPPELSAIPQVDFQEACRILRERFHKTQGLDGDLDTEGERLIGQWALEELKNPLIYVTGYAMTKRPVYTMPRDAAPEYSRSFDLLYHGVEITTGGQRIHRYDDLVAAMGQRGWNPADFEDYLLAFRHGMPPHGGMGMGLERITKQMLGLSNIKEACLFPRDRYRLRP